MECRDKNEDEKYRYYEKNSFTSVNFLTLPRDTIVHCIDYLDGKSFKSIKFVCYDLYLISNNQRFLLPQDEEGIKYYLLNSFNRALFISERSVGKHLAQKLIAFEEKIKNQNNHYVFSSIDRCNISNISWELCYKALYLGAHIGDSQARILLIEECERKKRRLEKYQDYLRDANDEKTVHLFCWQQVAFFNEADRKSLITAYEAGTSGITRNLQRAEVWKRFDWKSNSFSSFFKLS